MLCNGRGDGNGITVSLIGGDGGQWAETAGRGLGKKVWGRDEVRAEKSRTAASGA